MSRLDWQRFHRKRVAREIDDRIRQSSRPHRPKLTQPRADYPASLIEQAKAAKKERRFFDLPEDLSKSERKLVWRRVFHELRNPARRIGGP